MASKKKLEDLIGIVQTLRGENGCPWDKEQTRESIKPYLVEETYEVLEAIEQKDPEKIKEELGDVLLQIIFHAQLSQELGEFEISDVIETICEKLIRRHPHVFEDKKVNCSKEVLKQWEEIKRSEREEHNKDKALYGVPVQLPGLLRAHRLQEKAARVGFEWKEISGTIEKIEEEFAELLEAINGGDLVRIEDEIGDLLFAVVNFSRYSGVHAEEAIRGTIDRFIYRFEHMEEKILSSGRELKNVSLEEMESYWNEAKKLEP